MRLTFGLVIGVLVVLLGISILARVVFNVEIPLFRTAVALIILFIGVRIIVGAWWPAKDVRAGEGSAVFAGQVFTPTETADTHLKYSVVFGTGTVDLTHLTAEGPTRSVQVDTIFGQSLIEVDPSIPYRVEASSAFGEARLPDRQAAVFGSATYQPTDQAAPPHLVVKVTVVFGQATVRELPVQRVRPKAAAPAPTEEIPQPTG